MKTLIICVLGYFMTATFYDPIFSIAGRASANDERLFGGIFIVEIPRIHFLPQQRKTCEKLRHLKHIERYQIPD